MTMAVPSFNIWDAAAVGVAVFGMYTVLVRALNVVCSGSDDDASDGEAAVRDEQMDTEAAGVLCRDSKNWALLAWLFGHQDQTSGVHHHGATSRP